jgi:hypothetical protein
MEQIKNIMKEVYDHLMNGVLFHADMVDLFDFLHLKGFKKWQKNILEEELDNVTDMQHHFIKRHHMMLPPYQQHYESGLIPAAWYGQTAMDISKEDIMREVKRVLHDYLAWERKTQMFLREKTKELIHLEAFAEYMDLRELEEDVAGEIAMLEQFIIEMESVGYDCVYIQRVQERFCIEFG